MSVDAAARGREVPTAGTRWLRRTGKHRDAAVEVVETNGLSVFFKNLGGGVATGNQKLDQSAVHSLAYETFQAQYVPASAVTPNGAHGGGMGFRQYNRPKKKPQTGAQPVLAMNAVPLVSGAVPFNLAVEEVTPSRAEAWLEREVGHNRKPTPGRVRKLTRAIQRGEWQLTGDAIKFDTEGNLVDGGHRLRAIVAAGRSIQTLVIRGVEPDAFKVLDTGKARTPADAMGIAGFKNRVAVASAARSLVIIDETGRPDPGSRQAVEHLTTNAMLVEYAEKHPEIVRACELAVVAKGNGLSGGPGLLATLFALCLRVDEAAAELFAESLSTGANLPPDSPVLLYRRRLISDQRMSSAQDAREHLLALGVKAWNFWRRGERVQSLTWHPKRSPGARTGEDFPVAE